MYKERINNTSESFCVAIVQEGYIHRVIYVILLYLYHPLQHLVIAKQLKQKHQYIKQHSVYLG